MSVPSTVVDAIVTRLTTLIGSSALSIKAHDGNFGADPLANITVNAPAILVVLSDMPDIMRDFEPPCVAARFIALCIARNASGTSSKGDVAMDLAALVLSHVTRERWGNACASRAEKIGAVNMTNHATLDKGTALWAVSWTQSIELTPADISGVINRLGEIDFAISQGDEPTPGTDATLTFPEPP